MAIVDKLRPVAKKLLTQEKQGTIEIGRQVVMPGETEYDPPTYSTNYTEIPAIAKGADQKYVDGSEILATDLQIFAYVESYAPQAGDLIRVDGRNVVIIRQDPVPAAGVPVAWRFFVRG